MKILKKKKQSEMHKEKNEYYITKWELLSTAEKGRYDPPLRQARPRKMYTVRGMIYVVKYDNDARACNVSLKIYKTQKNCISKILG